MKEQPILIWVSSLTDHRLTYPKGVHSCRYSLFTNSFVTCSCIYIHFGWELQLDTQCVHQICTHWAVECQIAILRQNVYTWADNKRNRGEEIPEWVYVFWVCKPVWSQCEITKYFGFPFGKPPPKIDFPEIFQAFRIKSENLSYQELDFYGLSSRKSLSKIGFLTVFLGVLESQ